MPRPFAALARWHCAIIGWQAAPSGGVSELADEHDLGSCAARRAGSSPAFPTTITLCFLPQIWPTRLQQAPSNAEG